MSISHNAEYINEYHKRYRETHKEQRRIYDKEYRKNKILTQEQKEQLRENGRRYYANLTLEQKKERSRRSKKWHEAHPNYMKERRLLYPTTIEGRAARLYNQTKRNLKQKGRGRFLEHTITTDWIREHLRPGICEVTGIPFDMQTGKGTRSFAPSIDRINNDLGYTPENCRIVVLIYNTARGRYPKGDFDLLIERLNSIKHNNLQA